MQSRVERVPILHLHRTASHGRQTRDGTDDVQDCQANIFIKLFQSIGPSGHCTMMGEAAWACQPRRANSSFRYLTTLAQALVGDARRDRADIIFRATQHPHQSITEGNIEVPIVKLFWMSVQIEILCDSTFASMRSCLRTVRHDHSHAQRDGLASFCRRGVSNDFHCLWHSRCEDKCKHKQRRPSAHAVHEQHVLF